MLELLLEAEHHRSWVTVYSFDVGVAGPYCHRYDIDKW